MGLRGMELQKSAREILERLSELDKEWDRVEDPFQTLGTHLSNAQKQYEEAARALRSLRRKARGDRRQGDTEIARGEVAVAGPPASGLIPAGPIRHARQSRRGRSGC